MTLPKEYKELEYIETDGTQYLDLGRKSTPNTKFEFVYTSHKELGASFQNILGSQYGNTRNRLYFQVEGDNDFSIEIPHSANYNLYPCTDGKMYHIGYEDIRIKININEKNYFVYDLPNRKVIFNDLECVSSSSYEITPTDYNVLFFNRNNTSGAPTSNLATGKLYWFKWYEDDTLVLNLIPALRKTDKEVGMYDLVSNTFLTNAGTGSFSYEVKMTGLLSDINEFLRVNL